MSDDNPYQPPQAALQEDSERSKDSDKAGLLNTRKQDNLIQAAIIGATMVVGYLFGTVVFGVAGSMAGVFLGMVVGLLISGTYLMLFGRK